ncbi:MAG: hypothetical protein F6K53_42940 [Moorea sp. SIO4A1]|uniref:hypothetical protein n=1 Tax=Moorena sp. SIO4A1 TaxID=2607835 RepID=UPI00145032AA|nr:hypothetical protein [Moorena sp. SIO4A1]NEQ63702.1 hypothetical protein [Moorena sp. SIO4A1]
MALALAFGHATRMATLREWPRYANNIQPDQHSTFNLQPLQPDQPSTFNLFNLINLQPDQPST